MPPPDLGQELGPVRGVADGARRRGHHALGVELARPGGVAVEHGVHPIHGGIGQAPVGVDPVAEPRDLEQALDLVQIASRTSATRSRVEFVPMSTAPTRITDAV